MKPLQPSLTAGALLLFCFRAAVEAQIGAVLIPGGDTYIDVGTASSFEGETALRVARLKRVIVSFDLSKTPVEGLFRATLLLNISRNGRNWGHSGRVVTAHRMLEPCPQEGSPLAPATALGVLHTNDLAGAVAWDVTADVRALDTCGWVLTDSPRLSDAALVKPPKGETDRIAERFVDYFSTEGSRAAGNLELSPRLLLEYSAAPPQSGVIIGRVFLAGGERPLEGAYVTAANYTGRKDEPDLPPEDPIIAYSDSNGFFSYQTVPIVGKASFLLRIRKVERVDGKTVEYSEALRVVRDVQAGRCTRVNDAHLTPLASRVMVKKEEGHFFELPGGVTLDIPPGALGQLSLIGVTALPSHQELRDELPPLVAPNTTFVDITGVFGERSEVPVTLTVPNTHNLPVGTKVPFGKIDHNTLEWTDLRDAFREDGQEVSLDPDFGLGKVKSDGQGGSFIEVQFNHFCSVVCNYCGPSGPPSSPPPPPPSSPPPSSGGGGGDGGDGGGDGGDGGDGDGGDGCQPSAMGMVSGSSVIYRKEGFLWEEVGLPSLKELGGAVQVRIGYSSAAASPTATLTTPLNYQSSRPVERTLFEFSVEGKVVSAAYDRSTGQRQNGTYFWDGTNAFNDLLPTGAYDYTIVATTLNASFEVSIPSIFGGVATQTFLNTAFPGFPYPGLPENVVPLRGNKVRSKTVLVNLVDSPYGAGWSILEEPRAHRDPDGCVVLLEGNAHWGLFTPKPGAPGAFVSPVEDFSVLQAAGDGTLTRTFPNGFRQQFDAAGRIERQVNRYGYETLYERQGGLLSAIRSPTGRQFSFSYRNGKLARITDSAGRATLLEVDGAGDLTAVTDPTGLRREFEYDARHLLIAQRGPRGESTRYTYANGRVVSAESFDTDGVTLLRNRTFEPGVLPGEAGIAEAAGKGTLEQPIPVIADQSSNAFKTFRDGRVQTHLEKTDALGNVSEETDPLGRTTRRSYDEHRQVTSITRPDGAEVRFSHDVAGNVVRAEDLRDFTVLEWEYEPRFNNLVRRIDSDGREIVFSYDEKGALAAVESQGLRTGYFHEDARFPSLETRIVFPDDSSISMSYDQRGNLETQTDALGLTHRFERDAAGNITRSIDPRGEAQAFAYDLRNRLVQSVNELENSLRYSYLDQACGCLGDKVSKVTLPGGLELSFVYDGLGRLKRKVHPKGLTVHTYDEEGHVVSRVNRNGERIDYGYDDAGQLSRKVLPGGEVTTYGYDQNGFLSRISDGGCSLDLVHDHRGRLMSSVATYDLEPIPGQAFPFTHHLTFGYNEVGRRVRLQDDYGAVDYGYDSLQRLTVLTASGGLEWAFTHDALGRRLTADGPDGLRTFYSYDAGGRLEEISLGPVVGPPRRRHLYRSYDPAGNLKEERVEGTSASWDASYKYDRASQLTEVGRTRAFGDATVDIEYSYDDADRLESDTEYDYQYDDEGRLTERVRKATGLSEQFRYDAEDRLLEVRQVVTPPGGEPRTVLTAEYRYDPLGRRVQKTINGVVTRYLYDGEDIIRELDGNGFLVRSFVHGPGVDEPLAVRDEQAGRDLILHADRLGSITAATDRSGQVVKEVAYDAFGAVIADTAPAVHLVHSYTGRELDEESGLYYYRARFYEAEMGRFISEDPLMDGVNLYAYVSNNPVNRVDPLGLQSCARQEPSPTPSPSPPSGGGQGPGSGGKPQCAPGGDYCLPGEPGCVYVGKINRCWELCQSDDDVCKCYRTCIQR